MYKGRTYYGVLVIHKLLYFYVYPIAVRVYPITEIISWWFNERVDFNICVSAWEYEILYDNF